MKQKSVPLPVFIITVAVCIALFFYAAYRIDQLSPMGTIHGLYQSTPADGIYYNAQFSGSDFYVEIVESYEVHRYLSGTFAQKEWPEAMYLLTDDIQGAQILITLAHDGFYLYDTQRDAMIYLQRKVRYGSTHLS